MSDQRLPNANQNINYRPRQKVNPDEEKKTSRQRTNGKMLITTTIRRNGHENLKVAESADDRGYSDLSFNPSTEARSDDSQLMYFVILTSPTIRSRLPSQDCGDPGVVPVWQCNLTASAWLARLPTTLVTSHHHDQYSPARRLSIRQTYNTMNTGTTQIVTYVLRLL